MDKIKSNKEIVILLIVMLYVYILLFIGGCEDKQVGNRVFTSNDLKIALVCEDFKGEPFLELGEKGIEELGNEKGIEAKTIKLGLNDDYKKINQVMNKTAMKNNIVIVLGGWLKYAVQISSRELREKNFVVIDEVIDEPNVKTITYKNEEGGFLMGIIAGGETKTGKIGFVGGLNDEVGMAFLSGYATGVKFINREAYDGLINYENVRYTEDFKDKKRAYIKAKELYKNGCDIVFHACGSAGEGVFKAAKEMNKKAIGVDVDSEVEYPMYKDVIISSMIKAINKTVVSVGEEVIEGKFKCGIENKEELGVKEDMITFSKNTEKKVSKKTYEMLVIGREKVKNEEVEIPKKIFEVIEFNEG